MTGGGRHWDGNGDPVGVFDAKADAIAALEACGAPGRQSADRARRAWLVSSGPLRRDQARPENVLGHFGEFHPGRLKRSTSPARSAASRSSSTRFPNRSARRPAPSRAWKPLALPDAVRRDYAFVVDRMSPAADASARCRRRQEADFVGVNVFDLFEGRLARRRQEVGRAGGHHPAASTAR
jgi:phenylalanyl-tRNA synthetase beta chain